MATTYKKDFKGRNLKLGEDQQSNGRYRYRYTDKFGNRKSIYSWRLVKTDKNPSGRRTSDLSLREMIRNIERDEEDGINSYEANSISVYELVCKYLCTKNNIANSTKQSYIYLTDKHIKDTGFGKTTISNIKKSDVKKFYASLCEKNFSMSTIQIYQSILFPAFQMAVDDNLVRLNPCKGCSKEYPRNGLSSAKMPLTRKEQSELLKFVKYDKKYCIYYELIAFMLGTGCRLSETIGLTWNDINFETKTVSINHQILYKKTENGKFAYYASKPKNKTNREIPLQKEILNIMKEYKDKTYMVSKSNKYEVGGYSEFVFLNSKLKLYNQSFISKVLYGIQNRYNKNKDASHGDMIMPNFTAHTFRHTFCTRMAENGIDIKVLQEIMGHKSITITMQVYNHIVGERKKNEVERVKSALIVE